MIALLRALFSVTYPYPTAEEQRRARGLLLAAWITGLLAPITGALFALAPASLQATQPVVQTFVSLSYLVLGLLLLVLTQRGLAGLAALLLVTTALVIAGAQLILVGTLNTLLVFLLVLPLALGAAFLGAGGTAGTGLALAVVVLVTGFLQAQRMAPSLGTPTSDAATLVTLVMLSTGLLAWRLRGLRADAEARDERLGQLATLVNVGPGLPTAESDLLDALCDLARDLFGATLVQVYLPTPDAATLQRRARGGVALLGGAPSLDAAGESTIAHAFRSGQPKIAEPGAPPIQRAHLLPSIAQGVALPMCWQADTMALLDVQFTTADAARAAAMPTMMQLADIGANALAAARRTAAQQRALERAQAQLTEVQATGQAPAPLATVPLLARGATVGYDMLGDMLTPNDALPPAMRAVLRQGEVLRAPTPDGGTSVALPILLRGELQGAMLFDLPPHEPLTEQRLALATNVAQRLSAALESVLVFNQAQAQAERERRVSDLSAQLFRATDVPGVLQLAADAFNEALDAVQTRIVLAPAPSAPSAGANGHTAATPPTDSEEHA